MGSAAERHELAFQLYPYRRVAEQDRDAPTRHAVVIVGAGPVGLAAALDLGLRGVRALVLDDHEGVGEGSRAICFSKRTLEIADRLGAARQMLDKGVVWNVGKVFHDDRLIYEFDLQPECGHKFPAFINLQQPYFEKFLFDRIEQARLAGAPIEIRGRNRVDALVQAAEGVRLDVSTPDGPYRIDADWVIACDGARSAVRGMMGLGFEGRVFEDNFLIADVRMQADFPTERWFWFEPHFKSGASALLHKQPDDVWRIDFQLGWNIDRHKELAPGNVRRRIDMMLGPNVAYDLVWTSIYTFQCRRMERFRHGRVFFAGDSAHQVSPFGARGANSGIQDVDNLCWKLQLVIDGVAPDRLLDSYSTERVQAADENILNSTRATDFITPKSKTSRVFRNAVLDLAEQAPFARSLVNSGRLSTPCFYESGAVDDDPQMPARARPGAPAPDAPLGDGWLLNRLDGRWTLLAIDARAPARMAAHGVHVACIALGSDEAPVLRERYLGAATTAIYLIRPDQHVVRRWRGFDERAVARAIGRALCIEE